MENLWEVEIKGKWVTMEVYPDTTFTFLRSRKDRCILFTWWNETSVANFARVRLLKFGLTWPFVYWVDCIFEPKAA